jgi:hypothetical protein
MTVEQWKFKYGAGLTDFTNNVLSFSGFLGRQNFTDNYGGGSFNITIKNQTNLSSNFARGTSIQIQFANGNLFVGGKVIGLDYDDYQGNTGLSTATITCQDSIMEMGKWNLQNFAGYIENQTVLQAKYTNNFYTGYLIPEVLGIGSGLSRAALVNPYNGSVLSRLNLLNNCERGQLVAYGANLFFMSRQAVQSISPVSFNRSVSSDYSVAYTDIRRFNSYDNFMNQVTVNSIQSDGTAIVGFGNNTSSQTTNGTSGYQFDSVDYDTTQVTGLAQWLSNVQGDPTLLRFEVDFDDASASKTAIYNFLYSATGAFTQPIRATNLNWRVPGAGSDTTTTTMFEGFSFSGTPSMTTYTGYFSPFTVYQYFILDSTLQGILDTSRLGW